MLKRDFDVQEMLRRIEVEVQPYPKAALFELASRGHGSPFEILVACIISIRTRDEVTLPVALRVFARARIPEEMARLPVADLDEMIALSSFHEAKARQILDIAVQVKEEFGGVLPGDDAVLRSFPGVGPKCANLVLGIACGQARVSVDVHVDRVTNRWGYVATKNPVQTMLALEARVPSELWIDVNRLLVPFGKHVCTGRLPICSTCPVLEFCRQVGVTAHR
ncbi:MAG: endonuclease III domain-containing protein [Chloroflexota bacterium]